MIPAFLCTQYGVTFARPTRAKAGRFSTPSRKVTITAASSQTGPLRHRASAKAPGRTGWRRIKKSPVARIFPTLSRPMTWHTFQPSARATLAKRGFWRGRWWRALVRKSCQSNAAASFGSLGQTRSGGTATGGFIGSTPLFQSILAKVPILHVSQTEKLRKVDDQCRVPWAHGHQPYG